MLYRVILAAALAASPVLAENQQTDAETIAPADVPRGQSDYHAAAAGQYRMDPLHTAVLVRVPHMNFSISVLRFNEVAATLDWNPDSPATSQLDATVQMESISTPAPGFADFLYGADYLNTAQFPEATFRSTDFAAESDTAGTVTGDLTIMGQTNPATFDVTLVGAGRGYAGDEAGNPFITDLIGMTAVTTIDPQAYGLNAFFTDPIDIQIDGEFGVHP
ncbi:polyisoprenoid-binding protein [Paracoccus tegillarcae]|uniref:Polyisoprenoid-binding protein n=2 Tax=Paracoccus tegillarcae TaxID=1529068 RepID=A0A2K9EKC9_9RHOB|nr:polyisoprenoid-binding protein [Paracoccus tegillarcae]